jgi:hypothetical protein
VRMGDRQMCRAPQKSLQTQGGRRWAVQAVGRLQGGGCRRGAPFSCFS